MGRVSQSCLYMQFGVIAYAAVITAVNDDDTVTLTYFPPGGGAHGADNVKHVNLAKPGETHWKAK